MALTIDTVKLADLEALVAFARPFEHELLQQFPAIPAPEPSLLQNALQQRLEHGSGIIARQNGDIVGCLTVFGPIPDFRPGVAGIFAPLLSCIVTGSDTDNVFTTMLTELGRIPALAEVSVAAFTCPVSNDALNQSLSQNGFGIRCADSVVSLADLSLTTSPTKFDIEEVPWQEAVTLLEVKQSLARHLASSPMFMEHFDFTPEFVARKSEERQSVHFAARDGDRIIGYIEATSDGENYLTRSPYMHNICGAGVLPEYRNRGVMQSLLSRLASKYRAEGMQALGVDYETLNPNARGFWERFFTPYTWSWERRYDHKWGDV